MKLSSTISNDFFFKPGAAMPKPWRPAARRLHRFVGASLDGDRKDALSRKQEVICAVLLVLCLTIAFFICLGQLAGF